MCRSFANLQHGAFSVCENLIVWGIIEFRSHNDSNKKLANKAIKKGFDQLIKRVLLKEDVKKVSNLNFSNIRELVTYYNISDNNEEDSNKPACPLSVPSRNVLSKSSKEIRLGEHFWFRCHFFASASDFTYNHSE